MIAESLSETVPEEVQEMDALAGEELLLAEELFPGRKGVSADTAELLFLDEERGKN